MKTIKTNTELVNFKGEPLKNGEELITIGVALSNILAGRVDNPTLGWVLGKKFATEKEVDLKAEEVVFLKKELEKDSVSWNAIVTGQIIDILESKDVSNNAQNEPDSTEKVEIGKDTKAKK